VLQPPSVERGADIFRAGTAGPGVGGPRLAAQRIAFGSALAFLIGLLGLAVALLRQPNLGVREGTERPMVLLPIGIVLSAAMFLAARSERLPAARRVELGIAYLVVLCAMTSLFRHWLPYGEADVVRGLPPTSLLLLFFAVFVPVSTSQMTVAAVASVLADVAGLWFTVSVVGNPDPPWNLWVWLLLPNAVVVAVALIIHRFVDRLGETVRRARAMGAYHLVEPLGEGGMGEVWRADHRTLARPAAIKLIRPELLGEGDEAESALTRFEREARATAALTSPHTIAVYDFGRSEDGAFYYVMELLEGMDLQTMVREHGALPSARVVHLLLQVCHSLGEAHEAGVVHRDIKPANLFVGRVGRERDFLKVLDFGLVKVDGGLEAAGEDNPLTAVGALVGTPGYIAPEVAMGEAATPRSDLYSIGCVAYWLLTRRLVFPGRTAMQRLLAHAQEDPDPPSRFAEVDPALEALVLRCLSRDPAERPASTEALAESLAATGLAGKWTAADADRWWAEARERTSAAPEPPAAPTVEPTVPARRRKKPAPEPEAPPTEDQRAPRRR